MSRSITLILITLIIVLIAGAGFLIFQNQKLLNKLSDQAQQPTPALSPSAQASPEPSVSPSPKLTLTEVEENIVAAINSKNTAALASYMTSTVTVILQATECCGSKTPAETISQLSYVESGIPFDFNQNTDLVKNLKAKNSELVDKFIGLGKSGEQLVAFGFNSQNRISDIRMSVSYKLFSY